jgi:serine phosphatase RsbU (regulator of sigma subunit)
VIRAESGYDGPVADPGPLPIGELVIRLLEIEHQLEPSDVAATVRAEAERAGMRQVDIRLVDRQQTCLTSLHDGSRIAVDGTLAGDAYKRKQAHVSRADGQQVVIVPLLDGEDRLGSFAAVVDDASPSVIDNVRTLASVAAGTIVSKSAYSDVFEKCRRTASMKVAAELRWSLLPPLTFESPRLQIAAILEPAYDIAGDAFDYALNGDTLHLAMFDAVGHGMRASRLATLATGMYRNARREGADLQQTARAIDAVLQDQFGESWFVTALLGTLDVSSGAFSWLSFGHPAPLILRRGKVVATLDSEPSRPLGLGGEPPAPSTTRLEPDDTIVYYSDGVTEARNDDGVFFGDDGLADHLARCAADQVFPSETLRSLIKRLYDHRPPPFVDDVTVLLAAWHRDAQ